MAKMSTKQIAELEHKLRLEIVDAERKARLEVAQFVRETARMKHEWAMTQLRIQNAESKKIMAKFQGFIPGGVKL